MGIDYCSDAPGPCTHRQLHDSVTVSIPRQYGKQQAQQQALEFDAIVKRMRELGVAAWQRRETAGEQDD